MPRMTAQTTRMSEQLDRRGEGRLPVERQHARQQASAALTDVCTIQTRTLAADGQGGQTETWASTYKSVGCRLGSTGQAFGDERVFAGRLIHQADYLLIVDYGQALTVTDRIADVAGPDGVVKDAGPFEVLAVGKALTERVFTQALLRRVQ